MIADFDIATDLKVEMLLPDTASNVFILGISVLGGDDVLGGLNIFRINSSLLGGTEVLGTDSAFTWQEVQAVTSSASIKVGGDVQSALYFSPQAGSAKIVLQSWDYDPNVNPYIRVNTPIRVRLDTTDVDRIIFNGYINTIDVYYAPDQPNLIQIQAFDIWKNLVNSRIDFDTTGFGSYATPLQQLTSIANATGIGISPDSIASDGKIPSTAETGVMAASKVNEAVKVGLGFIWVDQDTQKLIYIPRPQDTEGGATTFIIGNDHDVTNPYHLCLSDISVGLDADVVYNSIHVALTSDDSIDVTVSDPDSIELWGESAIDEKINTTDTTELTRWATAIYSQTPTKLVKSVSTPTINRQGTLTNAAVFTPGTLVGVDYTQNQLTISDYYTVVAVSHEINVDNWYTTLDLWKEV